MSVESEADDHLARRRGHIRRATFMGAHVVPTEYLGRTDEYVDLVCGPMLEGRPTPRALDRRVLRGAGHSTPTSRGRYSRPGEPPVSGCAFTPTSWTTGPGVRLGVEMGCASVDHCTYLSDDDIEALAASETVATFLPAADFSTRQPYPGRPAGHRRRGHGGHRIELQSGIELHHLHLVLHRAGGARHEHDHRRGDRRRHDRRGSRSPAQGRGPIGAGWPRPPRHHRCCRAATTSPTGRACR